MARGRRPVRCRSCGYVTTPVSGFCPNCLARLPIGRRVGLVPILAVAGLLAMGLIALAVQPRSVLTLPAANQASPSPAEISLTASGGHATDSPNVEPLSVATASPTSSASPSSAVLGSQSAPAVGGNLPSTATTDEVTRADVTVGMRRRY